MNGAVQLHFGRAELLGVFDNLAAHIFGDLVRDLARHGLLAKRELRPRRLHGGRLLFRMFHDLEFVVAAGAFH